MRTRMQHYLKSNGTNLLLNGLTKHTGAFSTRISKHFWCLVCPHDESQWRSQFLILILVWVISLLEWLERRTLFGTTMVHLSLPAWTFNFIMRGRTGKKWSKRLPKLFKNGPMGYLRMSLTRRELGVKCELFQNRFLPYNISTIPNTSLKTLLWYLKKQTNHERTMSSFCKVGPVHPLKILVIIKFLLFRRYVALLVEYISYYPTWISSFYGWVRLK